MRRRGRWKNGRGIRLFSRKVPRSSLRKLSHGPPIDDILGGMMEWCNNERAETRINSAWEWMTRWLETKFLVRTQGFHWKSTNTKAVRRRRGRKKPPQLFRSRRPLNSRLGGMKYLTIAAVFVHRGFVQNGQIRTVICGSRQRRSCVSVE